MSQTLQNIINVIVLVTCQTWVCISMTPFRIPKKKAVTIIVSVTAAGVLAYTLTAYLLALQTAIDLMFVYLTIPSFICLLCIVKYRDGRFLFSYFFTDFSISVVNLTTFLFIFPTSIQTNYIINFAITTFVMVAATIPMVKLVCPRVRMMFEYGNSKVWWPVGVAAMIANIFMMFMASYPQPLEFRTQDFLVTTLINIILAVVFLVLIIAISEMCRSEEQKKQLFMTKAKLDISQMQLQQSERQYEGILENIDTVRRINHDMKHHFIAIEGLCKAGDMGKVLQYVSMLADKSPSSNIVRFCNVFEANVILSYYADLFKNSEIRYSFVMDEGGQVPDDPMPLCVILGNALENAREACGKMSSASDRFVMVEGKAMQDHKTVLRITNSYQGEIQTDEQGNIITSKPDKKLHGFGLENIRLMVAESGGWCEFTHDGSVFETRVVFRD